MSTHAKKRILVPTDFSEGSQHALHFATDLARTLDGEVVLLHVYELPSFVLPDGSVILSSPQTHAALIDGIQHQLAAAEAEAKRTHVAVTVRSEQGPPAKTILRILKEQPWYLVVMGTHGRSGIGRLLLGSVTEEIVRASEVPVLTLREPRHPHRPPNVPIL